MNRKHITIQEKISLVEEITEFSVDNFMVNSTFREIATVCYISKYYADYEFKTDENEQVDLLLTYDVLISSGIYYDEILKNINKHEFNSICRMIEDSIKSKTSLINIVLEKMDKLSTEDMVEKLNKIDFNKFSQVQNIIKTLQGK